MTDQKKSAPISFDDMLEEDLGNGIGSSDLSELSTAGDQEIAPVGKPGGLSVLDDQDFQYPKLKLCQQMTPETQAGLSKAGEWYASGWSPMQSVVVIPVAVSKTRVYSVGAFGESEISCESNDSLMGKGNPGGICKSCPMAQWTPSSKDGKNKPPVCKLYYNWVVYAPDLGVPVIVSFTSTGTTAAKQINTFAKVFGLGNFAVTLSGKQNGSGKLSWYEPTIVLKLNKDGELTEALELAKMMGSEA